MKSRLNKPSYIKVMLRLEVGDPKINADFVHRILMSPAFNSDEPIPKCGIPCIGDLVYLENGMQLGGVSEIEVTDD